MSYIRVGNKDCTYDQIILAAKKCASYGLLEDNWQDLALMLDTPDVDIRTWRNQKATTVLTLTGLLQNLLVEWVGRSAEEATLENLAECFFQCGMKDIQDELLKTFVVNVFQVDISEFKCCLDKDISADGNCIAKPKAGEDVVDFRSGSHLVHLSMKFPSQPMNFEKDDYHLPEDFKGFALVLNIVEYDNNSPYKSRIGAKFDSDYMYKLWMSLGYTVTVRDRGMFSLKRVQDIIKDFRKCCNKESTLSAVVFIGGHGALGQLILSDGNEKINLYSDIFNQFNNTKCSKLNGKPKIFILSACQEIVSDTASSFDILPIPDASQQMPLDDAVICYSTLPGYLSYRYASIGTIYAYCFVKVLMEEAHKTHLIKMIGKIKETMKKVKTNRPIDQMPSYLHVGMKKLYFNLKPQSSKP